MRLVPFGEQGLFYVKNSLNSLNAPSDIADRLGKGESETLSPAFISVRVTTLFPSGSAIFVNLYPRHVINLPLIIFLQKLYRHYINACCSTTPITARNPISITAINERLMQIFQWVMLNFCFAARWPGYRQTFPDLRRITTQNSTYLTKSTCCRLPATPLFFRVNLSHKQ